MSSRGLMFVLLAAVLAPGARADETLYRYEGDVLPYDESAGWLIFDFCEDECNELLEDGHFVLFWPEAGDSANYSYRIAEPNDPSPPPSLWIEWRFRSNRLRLVGCAGAFYAHFGVASETVYMYSDAAISSLSAYSVLGLDIDEFHTYRFESLDGVYYTVSVDGEIFIDDYDLPPNSYLYYMQLHGDGWCSSDQIPNQKHEWDYVRYGTISSDDRIIGSDPPGGYLDPAVHSNLDRFTVTFDAANYVYIDDVTVEVTGGVVPQVIQTLRRETDDVDTVEIVLDRPLAVGERTRFIFDSSQVNNTVDYCLGLGPICGDGCCNAGETCTTCAQDCEVCGDGCCSGTESTCTCPEDCTSDCGDGCCNGTEECATCPQDCEECGDGCCSDNETACTCLQDCPSVCPDGCCTTGEDHDTCPDDCNPLPAVSEWGLIILATLTLIVGTSILSRVRARGPIPFER